jgi:glycosyltransferase involved in cell wall biosynthesis
MAEKLKILACPSNHGGCAYYRILLPMEKLAELYPDDVEVRWDDNPLGWNADTKTETPSDFEYENIKWADVVFTQNIHNFGGFYTAQILQKAHELGKFTHFDTDDLLTDLYGGHRLFDVYKEQQLDEVTKYIYNNVDLVTVTQRKFAEYIQEFVRGALVIIKNTIDYSLPHWNMPKAPKPKKLTRMGWVGGIHHDVDVKHFAGIPYLVNQKVGKERVHWGFYGRPGVPIDEESGKPIPDWQQDVWNGYEKVFKTGFKGHSNYRVYPAMAPNQYGAMYTNIDINLAILDDNAFNQSKSEIKAIEGARYGIPLIATNVGCYDELIVNGETGYLIDPKNSKTEWSRILTKCIKDPKHVAEMGKNLKILCDELYDINKVVGGRLDLYRDLMKMKADAFQSAQGYQAPPISLPNLPNTGITLDNPLDK